MGKIAPVLLIVFNRPDTTIKVFEKIRLAKPSKLYIAADGPRPEKIDEQIKCKQVLDIVNNVDWECEVFTNYSEKNLGCGIRPSSAISWALQHEDRVIILEDDCVPSVAFFSFCTQMLEKYEDNERIMHISGTRNLEENIMNSDSYMFSRYPRPWGWATWRRAWNFFDYDMKSYKTCIEKNYLNYIFDSFESKYWQRVFNNTTKSNSIWDYQWHYAVFMRDGLCIVPQKNLISNIGDVDGTHPFGHKDFFHQDVYEDFEVETHPDFIVLNREFDKARFIKYHGKKPFMTRVKNKLFKLIGIKK